MISQYTQILKQFIQYINIYIIQNILYIYTHYIRYMYTIYTLYIWSEYNITCQLYLNDKVKNYRKWFSLLFEILQSFLFSLAWQPVIFKMVTVLSTWVPGYLWRTGSPPKPPGNSQWTCGMNEKKALVLLSYPKFRIIRCSSINPDE